MDYDPRMPNFEDRPLLPSTSDPRPTAPSPSVYLRESARNLGVWISRWTPNLSFKTFGIGVILAVLIDLVLLSGRIGTTSPNVATSPTAARFESDSLFAGSGRVTAAMPEGRIVVTGGGGNIGKNLIHRLLAGSTPVTIIDKIFYQEELDELHQEHPQARNLLQVMSGDIRNGSAWDQIMTPDVAGVIHLAAVSRVVWCAENQSDCFDVNERGTEVAMEALAKLNQLDRGQRWFLLASSSAVYGNPKAFPVTENSETIPLNPYGESKRRAEESVERWINEVWKAKSAGSLHAVALRLASVYGGAFDPIDRLTPSVVTQALAHQVIQVEGGEQQLDLIHIDDAVDAFLLAAQRLSRFRNSPSTNPATSFDVFNVASGNAVPVNDVVDKILRYTRSKSPVRYIPRDDRFPANFRGSTDKAWSKLGFQASISLDEGLFKLVKLHLKRTERSLRKKIDAECGEASPTIKANALSEMYKLNNCHAHMHAHVQGELAILAVPENAGNDTRWHVESRFPPYNLRIFVKSGSNGKPLIAIRDLHQDFFFGIRNLGPQVTQGPVKVEQIWRETIVEGDTVDWEMEVNAEKGTVKLILPGTSLQLRPPISTGGDFHLVSSDLDIWPFRVSPVCCEAPPPWPFFQEDPTIFQAAYQRKSLENPFLASAPKTLCSRLSRARREIQRDIASLSLEMLREPRREETSSPHLWANADLPSCSNSCDIPTVCINTGNCQCVISSCAARQRFPFSSFASSSALSYPPPKLSPTVSDHPNFKPLPEMVQQSSWLDILRPQAARFVKAGMPLLKVHVGELYPEDARWRQEVGTSISTLKPGGGCFSADTSLEAALSLMGVAKEDAEYTFIPYYQTRTNGEEERMFRTYDYSRDTNPFFEPERAILPTTSDWGLCSAFEWNAWDFRRKRGSDIKQYVRLTTGWTVMGDLNSPCYRPHQDVVIPPRTCWSHQLAEVYSDVSRVRPARDRSLLATFSGSIWGTGSVDRMKLVCSQYGGYKFSDVPNRRLTTNRDGLQMMWGIWGNYTYLDSFNDSIFCPVPTGVAGWSFRLVEAMYAGCIPVFIGEIALRPFHDMIDWSKISVLISSGDLNRMEEILLTRYSLEDVEKMQANILLARDAVFYPADNVTASEIKEQMIDRRGPLWFALQSTKMRMLTKWPMDDVYDRP